MPVHRDCFEIYGNRCTANRTDALHRLWTLAAWRRPWRRAYHMPFPAPSVDKAVLRAMSQYYRWPLLSLLHTLPTELLDMIRAYSRHSLLWRCAAVLQLADHVSATNSKPLHVLSLCELESWERGGELRVLSSSPSLPMRITLDAGGVSRVERVPGEPTYSGECRDRSAFILLPAQLASGIEANLKVRVTSCRSTLPTPRTNRLLIPPRTAACVSPFRMGKSLSVFGILRTLQERTIAAPTQPMRLGAGLCVPLRWTISKASPFSSSSAVYVASTSITRRNPAPWIPAPETSATRNRTLSYGFIYPYPSAIASLPLAPEKRSRRGNSAFWSELAWWATLPLGST